MQFDDFAASYNSNAFIQKDLIEWGRPFINTIPIENTSIFEFGAGTGLLTKHLIEQNPSRIVATDISSQMIIEGKKNVPQAHWELMDAWNARPLSVDHIFSSSLLQWCPNPERTIASWVQDLPENGTIQALFFIDQTLKELRQLLSLENSVQWRTKPSWESYFKDAGLRIVVSRETTKSYEFPSSLDLLKTLKRTGTSLKNELCGGQLKKILKEYDTSYQSSKGVISTWQFCQIVVQK